jgi:O-antigen ligase
MRGSAAAQYGSALPRWRLTHASVIELSPSQWTLTLTGLAFYLWIVHSFFGPYGSAGLGIALVGALVGASGLRAPGPVLWMGAWLAWSVLVGFATSPYGSVVSESAWDFGKIFLIFFIAANACRTLPQLLLFIGSWLVMFLAYPFRGQMVYRVIGNSGFGRYGWNYTFGNYNDFAAYDLLVFGIAAFVAMSPLRPKWRKAALAVCGAATFSFFLTQSRGALLGLVVVLPFYLARSSRRSQVLKALLALGILINVAAPKTVWTRLAKISAPGSANASGGVNDEAEGSSIQRYTIMAVALDLVRSNPLTGVGLGAYGRAHALRAELKAEWRGARGERDAHNLYLLLAAETGIPGLLLFLGMIASAAMTTAKAESRLRSFDRESAERMRVLRFLLYAFMAAAFFGTFHRVSFLYFYLAIMTTAASLAGSASFAGARSAMPSDGARSYPSVRRMRAGLRFPSRRSATGRA